MSCGPTEAMKPPGREVCKVFFAQRSLTSNVEPVVTEGTSSEVQFMAIVALAFPRLYAATT